ncbi:uncharacterized protein K452DRAFT_136973 [Aplosporella prunicola CBS 121167]|uniref:Uncharacterized protein n=1 Tax=Aplosporella prunicola CBS 121167 TaxID=1176127 RepID=A0A6A6BM93_9PEZI|nr:uncharacterized protein K452DRAFT_136973 [Aplosporella prunicola CBS 121167]KAF2145242.1 hypothetical protein K452DRAFT_136973 [Aplosporella prunicola CBS 121167]
MCGVRSGGRERMRGCPPVTFAAAAGQAAGASVCLAAGRGCAALHSFYSPSFLLSLSPTPPLSLPSLWSDSTHLAACLSSPRGTHTTYQARARVRRPPPPVLDRDVGTCEVGGSREIGSNQAAAAHDASFTLSAAIRPHTHTRTRYAIRAYTHPYTYTQAHPPSRLSISHITAQSTRPYVAPIPRTNPRHVGLL